MSKSGDVPCGACHACCKSELIVLVPAEGDDVDSYEHELVTLPPLSEALPVLKHRKNGDCVYLDRQGKCSIRERRPHMCRVFDCRLFFMSKTREERQQLAKGNPLTRIIFNAGKLRLRSLDQSPVRRHEP